MQGTSISDKEFMKLSHFDRLRRGYLGKIPLNFLLIAVTLALNVFQIDNYNLISVLGISMFGIGTYLKQIFLEKDNMELKQTAKEINRKSHRKKKPKAKGYK